MTRIYIAGPCSGHPDNNYPAFHAAAKVLRAEGWAVANPAEFSTSAIWQECLRDCIRHLAGCTHIYLLPGWRFSRGARLEYQIAQELGMEIIEHLDLGGAA